MQKSGLGRIARGLVSIPLLSILSLLLVNCHDNPDTGFNTYQGPDLDTGSDVLDSDQDAEDGDSEALDALDQDALDALDQDALDALDQDSQEDDLDLPEDEQEEGDVTPPAVIEDLVATPLDQAISLTWTSPADADLSGCEGYRVEGTEPPANRDEGVQIELLEGEEIAPDTEYTSIDAERTNGTTYSYTFFCSDDSGNWQLEVVVGENTATATPQAGLPDNPADVEATAGDEQVTVTFTMPDAEECVVMRGETGYPATHVDGSMVDTLAIQGAHSTVDVGLTNGVTYYYAVFCREGAQWNEGRTEASSDSATPIDTTPPAIVADLVAAPGEALVTLTWTNPDDDELSSCEVYRSMGPSPPAERTGEPAITIASAAPGGGEIHVDSAVMNGTLYSYTVFCSDDSGNWSTQVENGNTASATPQYNPPSNPTDVDATDGEREQVTVSFTMPEGAMQCELYRRTSGYPETHLDSEAESLTAFTMAGPKTYTDDELTNDTTYYYMVFCHNGDSWNDARADGNFDTGTPDEAPLVTDFQAQAGDEVVTLAWTNPANADLDVCEVYRVTGPTPPTRTGTALFTVDPATPNQAMTQPDTNVDNGTPYSYSVFCSDVWGNWDVEVTVGENAGSATPADTLPPDVVADLEAEGGYERVRLNWTYPTGDELSSCELYRSTEAVPGREGSPLTAITSPTAGETGSYLDQDVVNMTMYYYSIFCADEVGNWQEEVNAGNCAMATPTDISWVTITGGTYPMGSTEGDSREIPVHPVTITTFEMMQTEVTVDQWTACVANGGCTAPETDGSGFCNWNVSGRESHPVNCVDWIQARSFCTWVGGRLPAEAEWEYAARSEGQDISYPWGDETATCDYAVMNGGGWGCGLLHTWEVCSKPLGNTEQGLCDMAGNVVEWVEDDYHSSYDGAPSDGSAWVDEPRQTFRMDRGGNFASDAASLRAAFRPYHSLLFTNSVIGLRCAR